MEDPIDPQDLTVRVYDPKAGMRGMHVTRTNVCVEVTHVPTGTVAACQLHRSQHMNRHTAMRMIRLALTPE